MIDIGVVGIGPYAAALLGCLGADVLRIEEPKGDIQRQLFPRKNGHSLIFMYSNCCKKGHLFLDFELKFWTAW